MIVKRLSTEISGKVWITFKGVFSENKVSEKKLSTVLGFPTTTDYILLEAKTSY